MNTPSLKGAISTGNAAADRLGVPLHWPLRQYSARVVADGMTWHVQRLGAGPKCLLVHGTGASTHSFRKLATRLEHSFDLLIPDLPGHGFSSALEGRPPSIDNLSQALAALMARIGFQPDIVVGHSAGAAVAATMALTTSQHPKTLVSLNGAFYPFNEGIGALFAGAARALSAVPLLPRLFTLKAHDTDAVARMMRSTGSEIDDEGVALYAALLADPTRVRNVLRMMGHWDLTRLVPEMVCAARAGIFPKLHLLVGAQDRTVPPSQAYRLHELIPSSTIEIFPGLGHLAHEEQPEATARVILDRFSLLEISV